MNAVHLNSNKYSIDEKNMKLRELYQEGAVTRTLFTNRIIDLFALYYIAKPVITARKNIMAAQERYDRREPNFSLDQKNKVIEHELAQCAAQIAATLVGSSLLMNLGSTFINVFGMHWIIKEFADLALAVGQVKFMSWINSDQGRAIVGKWLTGQAFRSFGIIGDSGPMFDQYIGSGLKRELEDAEKTIKSTGSKAVKKIFGDPKQDPNAAKDIGNTSTPKTKQPVQVTKPEPGVEVEYDPSYPDNPYRVDVKRSF